MMISKMIVGMAAATFALASGSTFAGSSFNAADQKKAGKSLADCKKAAQKESQTFPANATVKQQWSNKWQKACEDAYKAKK